MESFKNLFAQKIWKQIQYNVSRYHYDIAFSLIQKKRNLKPNPYLADTARHLFAIAMGVSPGYSPATNQDSLPINLLQQVFIESYGLKKYYPTIMQPTYFDYLNSESSIYYSLQHPSTYVFSPKSREISSTLFELRELAHILHVFKEEFSGENAMCSDSIISAVAKKIEFAYFHNKPDRHKVISPSDNIIKLDKRFDAISNKNKVAGATFASDAPFVRGCININNREK